MMSDTFWLYQWMDEYGIATLEQAKSLLHPHKRAVRRLEEIAAAVPWRALSAHSGAGTAIVAGRGIDLSGDLDCCHQVCQRKQVDALFGRVLHYFDEIVVTGPPAHRYAELLESSDEATLVNIGEHVAALLYLREIGVEDMLIFVQKPPACSEHYLRHAAEAGILDLIEGATQWIDHLAKTGTLTALEFHDDHWHYTFNHRDLEHTAWGVVRSAEDGARPNIRRVAESVFSRYAAHLVSDVTAAKSMALPLGSSVQLHEYALARASHSQTVADVAFDLDLPVLDLLPIRDVVRLREDESEYFERFRIAVTRAIEERLSTGESSAAVAADVVRNVIDPAINDIDRRLRTAQRVLDRKLGASAVVGAVATTVGLLAGAPLIIGAGIAAIGTSLPVVHKFFEDKGSIELEDMYFLWRLEERALKR
jgi:hypothetical protein